MGERAKPEKEKIVRNPRKVKNQRNPRKVKSPKVLVAQVLLNPVKKLSSVVVLALAVPVVLAKAARNPKKVKNPRNPRRVRNPRKVKNLRNPRNPKVPVLAAAAKKMEPLFPQENPLMDLLHVDIASRGKVEKVFLG